MLAGLHLAPALGKVWQECVALALALGARKEQRDPGGVSGRHW